MYYRFKILGLMDIFLSSWQKWIFVPPPFVKDIHTDPPPFTSNIMRSKNGRIGFSKTPKIRAQNWEHTLHHENKIIYILN